ncbi:proton-conducting transporter membrane subunit [Phycisphaeraceae bacterium D3-23]
MNPNLIILLCVIPLVAGVLNVFLINRRTASRIVGIASYVAVLGLALRFLLYTAPLDGAASILVSQMGDWQAPFGITIVFDSLSGLLIAAAATVALCSYIHSFSSLDPAVERRYYHPLMQMLLFGVNMSFLTGDLFNLFVAFEVMLMSSYALLVIGTGLKQMRQAYKYILLNVLASTVFLMAAGMVYGMFGTLNIADLARIVAEIEADPMRSLPAGFTALSVMFLLVFGLKGAFFPLWFWLPDTYYTIPIAVAGLFGGLLTKVGVYTVARLFPLIFASDGTGSLIDGVYTGGMSQTIQVILIVAAAFTMFLAVLGAVSQHEVRRILSIHVISQVGYMVFGIAVMSGNALAGCAFYMVQHMVVKCALFLCCGVMEKHAGSDDLDKLGGLLKRDWKLGVLFFIAAMSLVGLPPLSGFFGKMVIIREGFSEGQWYLAVVGLVTGALTLLSMLKIWSYGYWNPSPQDGYPAKTEPARVRSGNRAAYLGIAMLVAAALFLGFGAEQVYTVAFKAGDQLQNPKAYVTAVLGEDAYDHAEHLILVHHEDTQTPETAAKTDADITPAPQPADTAEGADAVGRIARASQAEVSP